jgi:Putative zinc-finger
VSSSGSGEQHRPHRPAPAEQHLGDRLAAFVDGELTDDSRDRVLAHLASCPQCKVAAAEQRRLKRVVAGSELPAISAGLLARLQSLPGMDCDDGPQRPPGPPGDGAAGGRRSPLGGGLLGSGSAPRHEQFSFLGPAPDLVPTASDDSRSRGFRIHDSASRGRRFAFAAAGAFSMAAIAIGSALPMEAAVDGGARPDDGPAVSPLSAGQVSDTRGVVPRGVLGAEERRERHRSPVVAASATSVALTRSFLAPGVVPLVTTAQDQARGSVVPR